MDEETRWIISDILQNRNEWYASRPGQHAGRVRRRVSDGARDMLAGCPSRAVVIQEHFSLLASRTQVCYWSLLEGLACTRA